MRFPLPRDTIMEISNLMPSCSAIAWKGYLWEIFHPYHCSTVHKRDACNVYNLNGLSIVFYRSQSAHVTQCIQNLNGLSIVFYRLQPAHVTLAT